MKFQKQVINIVATLFSIYLVHAQEEVEKKQPEELILNPGPIIGTYNKNDLNEVYDESSIEIQCAGKTCTSSSDNVLLDEGKITISNAGTYIFGGELNGQLNIDATKEDLIHLILRNATISSDFGPALYSEKDKCKKLVITTEGQNNISDSTQYPEEVVAEEAENDENKNKSPDACIFISNNLTFNGKGSLEVNGNFSGGIRSKKNLKFVSGKINVVAKDNGIKAKESISVKEAEVNVNAGNSAIRVTKDTDPEEGFIVIDGGKVVVNATNDAIHAETHLTINDGYVEIIDCLEGLEGQMIDITGGDVLINASNDGINASKITHDEVVENLEEDQEADNQVENVDESETLEAEEDSASDDEDYISDEETSITTMIEEEPTEADNGESNYSDLTQKHYENDYQVYIRITGGKVDVRAYGDDLDAIDANGSLYIGGNAEVYASAHYGAAFGHISAIDADGSKIINSNSTAFVTASGRFLNLLDPTDKKGAPLRINMTLEEVYELFPEYTEEEAIDFLHKNEQMVELFGGDPLGSIIVYDQPESVSILQPFVRVLMDLQDEGTPVVIKDSEGNVLIERNPRTQFAIVYYTSPKLVEGETYTVAVGDDILETAVAKTNVVREEEKEFFKIYTN